MRNLVNRASTLRVLKRVLKNSNHPARLGALRFAAEHAYGKPSQDLTLTADLTIHRAEELKLARERSMTNRAEPVVLLAKATLEEIESGGGAKPDWQVVASPPPEIRPRRGT